MINNLQAWSLIVRNILTFHSPCQILPFLSTSHFTAFLNMKYFYLNFFFYLSLLLSIYLFFSLSKIIVSFSLSFLFLFYYPSPFIYCSFHSISLSNIVPFQLTLWCSNFHNSFILYYKYFLKGVKIKYERYVIYFTSFIRIFSPMFCIKYYLFPLAKW